jgi:hypothetical protein
LFCLPQRADTHIALQHRAAASRRSDDLMLCSDPVATCSCEDLDRGVLPFLVTQLAAQIPDAYAVAVISNCIAYLTNLGVGRTYSGIPLRTRVAANYRPGRQLLEAGVMQVRAQKPACHKVVLRPAVQG